MPASAHHGHVGQIASGLKCIEDRHHRGGLGSVALERRDIEQNPVASVNAPG